MQTILTTLPGSFFVFLTVAICIIISLENRNPTKTISWLLVLTLLPGVGFVLYLLFGENAKKGRWAKAKGDIERYLNHPDIQSMLEREAAGAIKQGMTTDSAYFDIADRNIMRLVLNTASSPIALNNQVEIFTEGEGKFAQMFDDIAQAKEHIHLEYFIIRDSQIGRKLHELLLQKVREGVKVRLLYDDFGCWKLYLKSDFLRSLQEGGCEVVSYLKPKLLFFIRNLNYRDHRKICIIDGKIGYIGGINIGDEYVHKNPKFGFWRDTHLRITGQAVYMLQLCFLLGWYLRTGEMLTNGSYYPKISNPAGDSIIQIVPSGADTPKESIYQAYFYAIAQARETVYIETPYFIPDEPMLTALKTAAMAGVDVRIIYPQKGDHYFAHNAALSYLAELMEAGGKVYFYQKGFIHSKMVMVDGEIASVGTANMDIRSFMINSEINAFIYDDKTVEQLYGVFYEDITHCRRIEPGDIAKTTLHGRLWQSVCRLFSPLL